MNILFQTARKLEKIVGFIGQIGAWMVIPLMLVIVYDVIMRRFFVIGSTQLQELEWHLHGLLFLLCLGWTYTKDSHIRIDILREKLSDRTRAVIELLGCLFFLLPYSWALIYFGTDYFAGSYYFNESSASATGLPYRWIIKGMMVVGFTSLFLAGLSRTLMAVYFLFNNQAKLDDPDAMAKTGFKDDHTPAGAS